MGRETVGLVKMAVIESWQAYVLINNRTEGNAPLTVQTLSDLLGQFGRHHSAFYVVNTSDPAHSAF